MIMNGIRCERGIGEPRAQKNRDSQNSIRLSGAGELGPSAGAEELLGSWAH
jgi:hypothetical protein